MNYLKRLINCYGVIVGTKYFIRFKWTCIKQGITFHRFGDEIVYLWPWARTRRFPWSKKRHGMKFLSMGFEAPFNSLRDIKALWEQYDRYFEGGA